MQLSHLFFSDIPDVRWELCAQMGIRHAFAKLAPELTGRPDISDLETFRCARQRFADAGFDLVGLEGDQMDMHRIKLGLPGREADAERYRRMLRNMGELGVKTLCYNFMPTGWFRTATDIRERGGARVTGFSAAAARRLPDVGDVTASQMWDNYAWFLEAVLPTAEEAGVRLALHPDDPPVPVLQGIARIFIDPDGIRRALALSDSPSHGLTFCQGTYTTMGADVPALVREWKDRLFFVHLRDVRGTAEDFHETFHDDGPTDMAAMLRLYREVGFDGPLRSDHVPTMAGEDNASPSYGMAGTLFGVGYIKGLMDALEIPRR
ncbi:MAG: mannonate dehydratase [Bacteroidales bacterium]|nr:mannonate dehydratase [Bacteroidales bacterium]